MGKKILWGVCGIGLGHTLRQLPLIEWFSRNNQILIFAYRQSYAYYQQRFANNPHVNIVEVAVPFWAGNQEGLDWQCTVDLNKGVDFWAINSQAMLKASEILGCPDLVISDYEPISAQYAYAWNAPLVTLDQQSKYFLDGFPSLLNAQTTKDETMRLRMFFPKARRIACSFFRPPQTDFSAEKVEVIPPIIRKEILDIALLSRPQKVSALTVYLSSQQNFKQWWEEIAEICGSFPTINFYFFGSNIPKLEKSNVFINCCFKECLAQSSAIITTAGHGLLSEAMFLGLPVYAMPLKVYEQKMNAQVIDQNRFGEKHPRLTYSGLKRFIETIPLYQHNIQQDRTCLLKGSGENLAKQILQQYLD